MQLKSFECEIAWSEKLSIVDLRGLILSKLRNYGEPLRWAITEVKPSKEDPSTRHVRVESMIIIS